MKLQREKQEVVNGGGGALLEERYQLEVKQLP